MILGMDFLSDSATFSPAPGVFDTISSITLENSVVDELYGSKDTSAFGGTPPDTWTSDTVVNAHFEGDLIGGSLDYKVDELSAMKLKRREKATPGKLENEWATLAVYPIEKKEDLAFEYVDRLARASDYEYAVVPVVGDIEQNYTVTEVRSEFDGLVVADTHESYQSVADVGIDSVSQNRASSVVTVLGNKYPYIQYNGMANYQSGTAHGLFVEIDWKEKRFKVETGYQYRDALLKFLTNGQPKIIKYSDGRMWLADIVDAPTLSPGNHPYQVSCSFNFVEIGDANSKRDLYDNGFISEV